MGLKTYTALTLWVCSSAAFAWQPLTYPIRSQSAYQRSIDTAMCYAAANKTKVNIRRESQIPPRQPAPGKNSSTGAPSRPPLPSSSFSAMPTGGTSMPAASGVPLANAPGVNPASGAATAAASNAAGPKGASSPTATPATTTTAAVAPGAASATIVDGGASSTVAASGAQTTTAAAATPGSDVKLPPLPAPEPPMTQYWAAYGACMQARGYVVAQ